MRRHSSSVVSVNGPATAIPALFTTTSGTPWESATRRASAATASASATSTVAATAAEPIADAVSAAAASDRSAATTRAPRAANACAVARPIPLPAPVTTTSAPSQRPVFGRATPRARASAGASGPPPACATCSATHRAITSGRVRTTQCPPGSRRTRRSGAYAATSVASDGVT